MQQSINKKKIYFYLFIFIFLSSIFNFNLIKKIKNVNLINTISITGVSEKERIIINKELKGFLKKNILFINKNLFFEKLNQFNFLDNIRVQKILPSKIIIYVKKTSFLGITIINGEKFYIGSNSKFTKIDQINYEKKLPFVFGKFEIKEFLNLHNILKNQKIDLNNIEKYYYYRNKRWDIINKNGLTIKLPSKNIKDSIEIFNKLNSGNKLDSIKILDLRIPNQIILSNE